MRWTDLPPASPVLSLDAWREAQRARGRDVAGIAPVAGPSVLVEPTARAAAWVHVRGSVLERGGLLLGVPVADAAGGLPIVLVHVTRAVSGLDDDATALSLRLDATVWSHANAQSGDGETVVGWFHSHPGLGAFFSDTDRRTQAAFFAQPFSLGWVIDPVRREEAWFLGPSSSQLPPASIAQLPPVGTE